MTPVLEALGMSVAEIGRTNAADLDDALSGAAVLVMALLPVLSRHAERRQGSRGDSTSSDSES